MKIIILTLIGIIMITGVTTLQAKPKMKVITGLDLNRYLGTWYEIARYDSWFEKGLVGCTATYSLLDNGKVRVLNQGYQGTLDGKHKQAKGLAKFGGSPTEGYLKVSFFRPFWADYYILELDKDYRYALVGSSSMKYLWFLSRTPEMKETDKKHLVDLARELGYPVDQLVWVPQKP